VKKSASARLNKMLLIHPPQAKPCEPPAGVARLAGALRGNGYQCTLLDANLEAQLHLLTGDITGEDTWSRRAIRNCRGNLAALRAPELYDNIDRYSRAVADLNRVLEITAPPNVSLNLANYQDLDFSPHRSSDLLEAAERHKDSIFFDYFSKRLDALLPSTSPTLVGFSLNYLSQAVPAFSMIGFLKRHFPQLNIVLGGGLVTTWLSSPGWRNHFSGLVDHLVAGPGEKPLLKILGDNNDFTHVTPDYQGLPLGDYLGPGLIMPYAASSGCYWNKCSFCPEKAEENPYVSLETDVVLADLFSLRKQYSPSLLHLLDNGVSPALMQGLVENPPGLDWYGFARVSHRLSDRDFCVALRRSGCVMLKLGIESGDQGVLDSMDKGIDLELVSKTLHTLKAAGIATYIYLLFGTPAESATEARQTLDFTVRHSDVITFLNLAIFNLPVNSSETAVLPIKKFGDGDLPIYSDFIHPVGWNRKEVRSFLDREFKRHPAIAEIIRRDPPLFTSNHAPFLR